MNCSVLFLQAEIVYLDTEPELMNPFKERMDDFFESAEEMLKRQQKKMEETQNRFVSFIRFLAVKDTTEQVQDMLQIITSDGRVYAQKMFCFDRS